MIGCAECGRTLLGRQRKFCSRQCKNVLSNRTRQSYLSQHERGRRRKLSLLRQQGSACCNCGYARNSAALEFHHLDPDGKSFALDLRSLSNRSWEAILVGSAKCILLCSNCHAELHNPDCMLPQTQTPP